MTVYIQILGAIAVILWCYSIQKNNRKDVLKLQIFANIFYAGQYFFLGAISTAIMNMVSVIRMVVFYKNEEKKKENSVMTLIIFILCILIIWVFDIIYNGFTYYGIIPIMITIAYTYAIWQPDLKIMRITFLIAAFLWIGFNITVGAYVSVIGNIIEIVSGIVAIVKYDLDKNRLKKV